ncbi:RING finger protein 17 isoform X3 [Trachemys scripta elegans]|uniref:RING finger protein 17 isoform X3 n=1 Tax=Trachemys scripta elegans TaxID=31138 RepID=UPI0015565312|nr:RING finger protein 17 isoform X3 [Trachemys scripta elegans]
MAAAQDELQGQRPRAQLCVGCSRRGTVVSQDLISSGARHHALQCGHIFCELCLSVTQESSIIVCVDCEAVTTVNTNQGFYPMDDYVEEELYTRKLQAVKQSLQTLQDNPTRSYRGNNYLCHMLKEDINSEESQENHLGHSERDEDCDLYDLLSPKMEVDFEQGICIRNSQALKRSYIPDVKEQNVQSTYSDYHLNLKPVWITSAEGMDNKTEQDIDEALWITAFNLERLKTAEKMLGYLESKVKQEEDRIVDIIDKKFDNLITSLQSRKRKLHAELVKNTDNYVANIIKAKQYIEEKKNNLNGAMRLAKELKITPSLRTCCDLNQVIHNLKLTVEGELSRVDTLKEGTSLRFLMNCDEITSMFKNIGKIELEIPTKCCPGDDGQSILMVSNQGEVSNCDTYLSVEKNKFTALVRGNEAETLIQQELDVHTEVKNVQLYQLITTPSQKSILTLPQTMSGPDVIIEEIMEDDQETHSTEYLKDTHKKNLSQKKVIPFGQSAGARIFINSKENGMWCRGTITELIPLESKNKGKHCGPLKYKIYDVAVMQVFMEDFGNSEVLVGSGIGGVPVMRPEQVALQNLVVNDLCMFIRKPDPYIEAQLWDIPPLAVQCSLKDIVPKNSNEGWGEEVKTNFLRMVNNKAVLMEVFREEDGVLIVDLKKPPVNKMSDMPVSLKDALVFTELARFRSQLPSQPENNMALQYCPPTLPQEMTEVSIVVCHINSPSDFYLQLIESLDFLVLLKKIEEVYKNDDGENLEILCPVQGQTCVAKFEDGVWYRAKVTGLPGHQEVEVKYVDFGNTAKITLKDMRKIKEEFLSPPEKAIRSKLAHIEPYKGGNEWSREAKERFEEMIQNKFMLCSVISISQDNVLSVELFDSPDVLGKRSASLNSQLVKEELASYVLGYTKSSATEHNEVWDSSLEEIFETETLDILNSKNIKSVQNEDLRSLSNKELQVRISHVVSPNKIFVQWLSSERLLKSLQEKMAAIYENSKFEQVKWENDMYCAIRIRDLNQWQRGKINRVVSETTVEVVLYDFGTKEIVNINCLRKLDEKLKPIRALALECSLVDIRPAGGSKQWTATACDCISYYLTGAIANIIIQENDGSEPLPVKIFCSDEAGQLIDISEYLMKKGLAFRNKRTHEIDISDADPEKPLEVPLKQESPCLNELILETECTPKCLVPEKEVTLSVNEPKEHESKKLVLKSRMDGAYKPPIIPDMKELQAIINCIGDDGTIYMVPKSLENELNKLMADIQNNFKCLGLLEPYCWRKEAACVVRGSDTMWYRGKVIEVGGGTVRVQYVDYGYIEKIPQCHLYPVALYADIPTFCIPCQLYKTVPVGNIWQQDAVELLQELLTKRVVKIHLLERPDNPWGKVSVNLYFDGMSLSSFMAYHKYCIFEDCPDISNLEIINYSEKCFEDKCQISYEELLLSEAGAPVLPPYTMLTLPIPGELFPVSVKHLVSPNKMYICLESAEDLNQGSDTEDSGVSWDLESESLDQVLKHCNQNVESLPFLTDFRTEMPCLAEYNDGLWYRAKLLSIKEFDPVNILVEFVDYGSSEKLPTSRLRQIPSHLMQYPVQAVKVLLAGFKPPLYDTEKKRIPYCPEWSMQALWTMMDCLQGKKLYASTVTQSPENTVFLYEDERCLVHMKLVEMGLADLDQ